MKPRSVLASTTLLLGLAGMPVHADAVVIEASFAGIASSSRIGAWGPTPSDFDGQTVTGSLRFDTGFPANSGDDCPPGSQACKLTGSLSIEFVAAGQTATFDVDGMVGAYIGGNGPEIEFWPDWTPYHEAWLILIGPLFDGLDPSTFHPGTVDLEHSSAFFFDSRDFGADVQLTSFTFKTSAVPEAASWAMCVAALGVLGASRARRSATRTMAG